MSLEYQGTVKELADKFQPKNLIAILGFLDLELIEIYAETLINGDPSYSGSLAGVALRLPVYHVLEPEIKAEIPENVYQEQLGLVEISTGQEKIEEISKKLQEIRKNLGS